MKNLLVFRLSAMGDVAMTVPVIKSLLRQHPDVSVTMLSNPKFAAMYGGETERFRLIGVDTKNQYNGLLGMWKLYKALKKEGDFDMFIDLHDVIRSKELKMLMRLSGKKTFCIDKGRDEKKKLLAHKEPITQQKTSIERYADTFAKAGYEVKVDFESLMSKDMSTELPIGKKDCKWVGVAPFAQHEGKIYPTDKMKDVVKMIAKQENVKVLLFGGGKKESEIMSAWECESDNIMSLAGKFGLETELQIMNQCDVMLSMDSSNMHLASLVNTPVVSVWGATHPYAGFYGYNQPKGNAIQLDMECRPCSIYGNKPCKFGNYACLNNIKPETIAEKVIETIK